MKLTPLLVVLAAVLAPPNARAGTHATASVVKACATTAKHFEWKHCLDTHGGVTDTVTVIERQHRPVIKVPAPKPESEGYDASMGMPVVLADASAPPSAPPTPSSTPYASPHTDTDAVNLLPDLVKDVSAGASARLLAVGLAVLVLTYAFRKYGLSYLGLSPAVLPYVAVALGVASEVGLAIANGKSLGAGVISGVLVGLAAVGKHEVLTASGAPVPTTPSAPPAATTAPSK